MTTQGARRCAVLGSPIAHSLSPAIHQAAYHALGLDWTYTAHDIDETQLADFVAGLDASWRGLSLTMPLKRVALDVADDISELARTVGAANTLLRSDEGRLFADNTDVPGAVSALGERGAVAPAATCVWGGGATAASILAALISQRSGPIHLHVRSRARAHGALSVAAALGRTVEAYPWQLRGECSRAELTVNTAPAGAMDGIAQQVTDSNGGTGRMLFEVLYDPWPTPLAHVWRHAGGAVVSGLDLLVHQARGQVTLMTGRDVEVQVLRAAAEEALAARASS